MKLHIIALTLCLLSSAVSATPFARLARASEERAKQEKAQAEAQQRAEYARYIAAYNARVLAQRQALYTQYILEQQQADSLYSIERELRAIRLEQQQRNR